ncbi:DMSO/TMAO reductase YedYZ molybdopterin-dependent catalytic subunit [Stackebrandtia albiflava]|uniref:DMSO/TMAO reductase YedYZ molybdopterin-dependent catalytic subunit n=1 Tax=Stackebrandtia albiflava TaxID=406432 RepID=A0A562VAQ2_9ACTN|nr:molybdopterin-dependent oxidoreductase [Stackebrandtia albiflava]TWJ14933.1 DMSO/TMAO reductase YedYZ molybdopterin-dependent catalytic subunit [Stackebrandtia albiflava]
MRERWIAAAAGIGCAAVAVATGSLVALATGRATSPVVAVGAAVVDVTPEPVKDFAIRMFGEADKAALLIGIGVLLVLIAAGIGLLAQRRPWPGYIGLASFGLLGAVAAWGRPGAQWWWALPSLVGALAAAGALWFLLRRPLDADPEDSVRLPPGRRVDRRGVLFAFAAAGAAGVAGVGLSGRDGVSEARAAIRLPAPASPGPAGTGLDIPGLTPYITPKADFYRVDTALVIPRLHPEDYVLEIGGRVARPLRLSYADLLDRPLIEREITLSCVSNQVGGDLAGNAAWLGVPLADLLDEARPESGADQVVGHSADGWTCGTPTAVCRDGRDAMLAVGMNGEPLPLERGFPVRMIVPGLYGYVSATKWLVRLELSSFDDFDPYWVRRDWAAEAPVKTFSRIDTPKPLSTVGGGEATVAGVAWAQHRGIAEVEVRVDEGAWQTAELAPVVSADTWRQWRWRWTGITPGRHTLQVRATDNTGQTQPEERVPPFPDGATGRHSVVITAS